jgi:hypothetical protein
MFLLYISVCLSSSSVSFSSLCMSVSGLFLYVSPSLYVCLFSFSVFFSSISPSSSFSVCFSSISPYLFVCFSFSISRSVSSHTHHTHTHTNLNITTLAYKIVVATYSVSLSSVEDFPAPALSGDCFPPPSVLLSSADLHSYSVSDIKVRLLFFRWNETPQNFIFFFVTNAEPK